MTIQREINGEQIDITLTDRELCDAYYEKQHIWDRQYVLDLAEMSCDPRIQASVTRRLDLLNDEEFLDMVAHKYRACMIDEITSDQEYENFVYAYTVTRRYFDER